MPGSAAFRGTNRRQFLQFIGLTIVGVACAPSAPPAAAPTSAPAAKPTTAPAAAAAPTTAPAAKPAGGATVTLKVAHVTTAQKVWDDAWAGIWSSFESKNPGIKLEIENNPFNGYQEKMLTSLAGGSDFDIISYFINREYLPYAGEGSTQHDDMLDCMSRIREPDVTFDHMERQDDDDEYEGSSDLRGGSWESRF